MLSLFSPGHLDNPGGNQLITNPRLSILYVSDRDRTLDFLTKILDFELMADVPLNDGGRWVEVRPKGSQTCVVLAAVEPDVLARLRSTVGRMTHGWFDCDDLDATVGDLRARGVTIVVEPQVAPWRENARWAQIAGDDGNLYGLTERGH
ncbi:hypothetical protein GCM10010357_25940 [Streptomyces luteireticuli]|uniref:VOC domain-containing protein n=1 Tax=Streptomyces luteireticuli TaxID=173858 RepID=A0ABP3IHC5_9ACTN